MTSTQHAELPGKGERTRGPAVNKIASFCTKKTFSFSRLTKTDDSKRRLSLVRLCQDERGAITAEYAVVLLAATGFAGLLVAILASDTARGWIMSIVEKALHL